METTVMVVTSRSLTDMTSEQHMVLTTVTALVVGWLGFA